MSVYFFRHIQVNLKIKQHAKEYQKLYSCQHKGKRCYPHDKIFIACIKKTLIQLHKNMDGQNRSILHPKDHQNVYNKQGGPKVGIQLLNYFLCALKLPAVHFMWPKSRHTVNGENYLEILCEVVVPQLQTKPNFDELFFKQDGTSPHYALRVRDYLNKVFTQRWFGRTSSIEWPPCSPDLTPMDFFFWGVVKNKEYVKNKEKNPKTVNELKDCIYDAFREIDAN